MKKLMLLMAIVAALSFLASVLTVAPAFAVEATKTGPTPKQAPAQKTAPASQFSKSKVFVHTKFWSVEAIQCDISYGIAGSFKPCGVVDPPTTIKLGKISGSCSYKIKTPPVNEITEADANYWGKKSGYTTTKVLWSLNDSKVGNTKVGIVVPGFTWEDVQTMRKHYTGKVCLGIGHMQGSLQSMTAFYNQVSTFEFSVEATNPRIKNAETNYDNNKCSGNIYLLKSNY